MADFSRWWRRSKGLSWVGLALWLAACTPVPVRDERAAPVAAGRCDAANGRQACPPAAAPPDTRGAEPPPAAAPEGGAVSASPSEPPAEPQRESDQQGLASWYGASFQGRRTASGEPFNRYELTAAHRTLPFGSRVCVRSAVNGKTVVVRINDRGPFSKGRVIDLSQAAAEALGMIGLGIKPVELWQLEQGDAPCPETLEDDLTGEVVDDVEREAPRSAARRGAARKAKPVARRGKVRPRR